MGSLFLQLEARLDKVQPARRCLCGLSLRACVMFGCVFMLAGGCVMLVHSPWSMVATIDSLFHSEHAYMHPWAFVYVHVYVILLHLLTTIFLLYAVPLSVLALKSAFNFETTYLKSYFRMNVQVVGLLVLGSFFNTMLDRTMCAMRRENPYSDPLRANGGGRTGESAVDWQCDSAAHALRLFLSIATAVVYCYLAWITYCFRRELEQGSQLEEEPGAGADPYGGAGGGGVRDPGTPEPRFARRPAEVPMGAAVDVEIPDR